MIDRVRKGPKRSASDETCAFGRRVGWYAFARILKPRVVVETGVDKGLGSVVLCAALMRNQAEGFPGQYFGTDINPDAGFLLAEPYNSVGRILYGDSIQSLQTIPSIDLFVNDSDHSSEYERREYETIASRLSEDGLILGDNCHCNDVLADFSARRGRQFVFFREEPKDHWYPGGGIGISFIRDSFPGKELSNRRFASGEPISKFHARWVRFRHFATAGSRRTLKGIVMTSNFRRITSQKRFIPQIDGLRFVAILSVVLFHLYASLNHDGAVLNSGFRPGKHRHLK